MVFIEEQNAANYIYIERERERKKERKRLLAAISEPERFTSVFECISVSIFTNT
jgi:hypothetical protein